MLVMVLLFLLLGLLGVLFFLPAEQIAELPPPAEVEQLPPPPEALEAGADDSSRSEAVAVRETLLSLQIEAESENISQWGGKDYRAIETKLAEADELFQNEQFPAASRLYRQAVAELQALTGSREERLETALQAGQGLLAEEKPAEAEIHFRQALAIEPSSEAARAGLSQAELLAAVLTSYRQAVSLEKNGRLEEAVEQLKQALELDSGFGPALKELQRIQNRIDETVFKQEMNILLLSLDEQDFASARSSLTVLKKLGIKTDQVRQAETLVVEREKLAYVESLRGQAGSSEDSEQWQQALEHYDRILQAAPDALFAVAGREEAAKRAKLDAALGAAIDRPQRLQDSEQRMSAGRLLAYAEQIDPRGPKLESQIDTLSALLTAAETPVTVTLESDNQTDVAIYHVGRIGAFFSHRISLEPGTYTIVGSKPGYRDVRKEMTIAADGDSYRFDIRCEEPI